MALQKEVTVEWCGNRHFTSMTKSGTLISLDAAVEYGGQNAGAQPMELMLISLAGCTAMDVLSILEKKRQTISQFQVKVEGVQQEEPPRIFTDITITYIVTGRKVDSTAVERAIELSTTKYCPAFATLSKTATMHTTYQVRNIRSRKQKGSAESRE